jgi:hypothetical protein
MRVDLTPSAVEHEFSLRPRWWTLVVCTLMIALGAVLVLVGSSTWKLIGYLWLPLWIVLGALVFVRMLLRQKLQITNDYLILPRSAWVFSMIDVPLRHVSVEMSPDKSWLTIMFQWNGSLEERAFSRQALGEDQFIELERAINARNGGA